MIFVAIVLHETCVPFFNVAIWNKIIFIETSWTHVVLPQSSASSCPAPSCLPPTPFPPPCSPAASPCTASPASPAHPSRRDTSSAASSARPFASARSRPPPCGRAFQFQEP